MQRYNVFRHLIFKSHPILHTRFHPEFLAEQEILQGKIGIVQKVNKRPGKILKTIDKFLG